MSRAGWHYGSVDAVRNEAGVGDQSDECRNGTKDCPGPDADVDELPCLECLADASDGDREVATDGGQCVDNTDREHGRCDVCGKTDYLERIPLGTRGSGVDVKAVDAKLCESCNIKLANHYRTLRSETDRSEGEEA